MDENQVIDQIGALMQQLPPEKQQQVLEQLAQLLSSGQEQVPAQGAPEQAPNAVPVGM